MTDPSEVATIVVGVDGSAPSKRALRWAAHQARLTGATVRAVAAWQYPLLYGLDLTQTAEDLANNAATMLSDAVHDALGPNPGVAVRESVVDGNPAQVLLEAARGAQLLVVGSHGYAGFKAALLGSVSHHCAQHSPCPVVIIRGAEPVVSER